MGVDTDTTTSYVYVKFCTDYDQFLTGLPLFLLVCS